MSTTPLSSNYFITFLALWMGALSSMKIRPGCQFQANYPWVDELKTQNHGSVPPSGAQVLILKLRCLVREGNCSVFGFNWREITSWELLKGLASLTIFFIAAKFFALICRYSNRFWRCVRYGSSVELASKNH